MNGQQYSWSADRANVYARMNAMNQAHQGPMGGQQYFDPNDGFKQHDQSQAENGVHTSNAKEDQPLPSLA